MGETENKAERILSLYTRLQAGETIDKQKESDAFQVSTRTIQRDLNDIQCFLENQQTYGAAVRQVIYDRASGGYRMIAGEQDCLEAKEILAICKVLLESRCLMQEELFPMLGKLIRCGNPDAQRQLHNFIENERYHYTDLHHGKRLLDTLWKLEQAVWNQNYLEIRYHKASCQELVARRVRPVGILFSEFYFYLLAYIEPEKKTENKEVPEKERADSDSVNGSAQIREHILNEKKQPPDKSSVSGEEKLTQSLNADFKERNQAFCRESCGAAQPDEENSHEPYQVVYGSPREQSPTIYRIDRLERLKVLDDHFLVEYASRFEEGELRKRIQFMYGGKLKKVRFRYHGTCPDYILDRLPTAKIIRRDEDGMLIEAEVFGDGIHFWMKGQGEVEEVK